jgi:hypothetical protein
MAMLMYPGRLRQLMTMFRSEMDTSCPDAKVRLTYAPFDNLDVLIEVYVDGRPAPTTLVTLGEQIGRILDEGYTVRAVVKQASWQPYPLNDIDLMVAASG